MLKYHFRTVNLIVIWADLGKKKKAQTNCIKWPISCKVANTATLQRKLHGLAGLSLRGRSSDIWRDLSVDLLCMSKGATWGGSSIWLRSLLGASLWRFFTNAQLGRDLGVNPEPAGEITYLAWPVDAFRSPRRNWKVRLGRRLPGIPCLGYCHHNLTLDKWIR